MKIHCYNNNLEKGIYSTVPHEPEIAVISVKYPDAVFTLNSAFYYHNLTDTIPDYYYLATEKNAYQITDKRVVQKYENSNALHLGEITMEQDGCQIKIYNKERMLLELIRNKNSFPFDYYKEILNNYRQIIHTFDRFIGKLNCLEGITIKRKGAIEEKDIFDMYYLCKKIDKNTFKICLSKYIFDDEEMRENDMNGILKRVKRVFSANFYKRNCFPYLSAPNCCIIFACIPLLRASFFIVSLVFSNCLISLFTSATLVPLPLAILLRREGPIIRWLARSFFVMERMIAS